MAMGRFRGPLDEDERKRKALEAARIGLAHMREGNLRQAEYDLNKAVLIHPEDATLHGYFVQVLHRLGRDEDARRELQTALSLAPHDESLHQMFNLLHQDNPQAIRQHAPSVPGNEPSAEAPAASAQPRGHSPAPTSSATDHGEVIARMEAEVAAHPTDSRLHRDLSNLYLRVGRLAEAREHIRLADALRKRNGNAASLA